MSGAYDVHAHLQGPVDDLAFYLGRWEDRDDGKPAPDARRAANTALDSIDELLAALHGIRSRLVTEIRHADDATAVRADALLREGAPALELGTGVPNFGLGEAPQVPGYLAGNCSVPSSPASVRTYNLHSRVEVPFRAGVRVRRGSSRG